MKGRNDRFPGSITPIVLITLLLLTGVVSLVDDEGYSAAAQEGGFITEKEGFKQVQVWGNPYQIGYQHGSLLSDLVPRSLSAYAHATERSYGLNWDQVRLNGRTYWRLVPQDQKDEISGIAEGSASNGALNPNGDPVDWIDILSLNAIWDIWWRAEPPGNPWWWLPFQQGLPNIESSPPHHCSAFVATGRNYTADGGFVMAQSLWMPYFLSPAHAIFIDIIPDRGNRIFMELTAGMIWSGTEWYQNSAGLVIAETTLGTGPYIWGGVPSFVRLREAAQYADDIDSFKDIMLENTNGAYCGDYLLADSKTNEVAILELGAHEWAIKRTTDGFLPSCNYPWDEAVAEEMGAPRGWDHGCYPRWVRWEQLRDRDMGEITVHHAMEYLGDHWDTVEERENPCSHTLCGHVENESGYPHGSLDGKAVNRTMAMRMETWARFGHSCGQPFIVSDHAREHPEYAFDDLIDIIPRPFASFGALSDLRLQVMGPGGRPVGGARVTLTSTVDGDSREVNTGSDGRALLERLPHSEYDIDVETSTLAGSAVLVHNGDSELTLEVYEVDGEGGLFGVGGFPPLVVVLAVLVVLLIPIIKFRKRLSSTLKGWKPL